jgi:hypothetical protein
LQLKKKKNSAAAKIKLRVGEVKVYRASMA